jgi:hypothetical protein
MDDEFFVKQKALPDRADKLTVKICEAEVFSGLLLLLWRYYAQKPIVFALSPLRLEQACASLPPSRRGAILVACSFVFKLTAEISVIAQISVIQVTVVSCVSV